MPTSSQREPTEGTPFDSLASTGRLLVSRLEKFGALSNEDKAVLLGITAEVSCVEAGEDLVYEGASPLGVFVIVKGFACRYKLSRCGSRHIMAYLLPGDFCDLDVLVLPRMDHNVGALSDCAAALLSPVTVHSLLAHPNLARALRLATLIETATLREWLVNIGTRRAAVRIAHLFCSLHSRLSAVGLADLHGFYFPLTQTDLAETMGMTTVHMNRSLQELRGAELIELHHSRLTILDLPKLKVFAQFEPSYPHSNVRVAA